METSIKTDSGTTLETELQAPNLVFFGLVISWRKRPSDLRANTTLAERWEDSFAHWSVDERRVMLVADRQDYRVSLGDGTARFEAQSGAGYRRILALFPELLDTLRTSKRDNIRGLMETQHLRAEPVEFPVLVARLSARTLNSTFLPPLGAELLDFAYLSDVVIDRRWYQINFGPVRAHEIPRRVRVSNIEPPAVALFLNVATKWTLSSPHAEDLTERATSILSLGNHLIRELAV